MSFFELATPEQWWLEGYFPFGKAYFVGAMLNFQGVNCLVVSLRSGKQYTCHFSIMRSIHCIHHL